MPTKHTNPADKPLNVRQRRFVEEYLVDHNGTRAAIRAGYKAGPNGKTASVTACELMARPNVKKALDKELVAQMLRINVKADDVLRELMRIALADVGDAFNEDGTPKDLDAMPPDLRRAISSFEVEELFTIRDGERVPIGSVKKIRFWPKHRALEMLGKYLRLFVGKVEHTFPDERPTVIQVIAKE